MVDAYGFPLVGLTTDEAAQRDAVARATMANEARYKELLSRKWPLTLDEVASPPARVKTILRNHPVPPALRPALWLQLSGGAALRDAAPPRYYSRLLESDETSWEDRLPVVEGTLLRLFPSHAMICSPATAEATTRLVGALAQYNHGVVAAQPCIAAVAAFLLVVMGNGKLGNQEDSFWTLAGLVEHRLHPHFFQVRCASVTLSSSPSRRKYRNCSVKTLYFARHALCSVPYSPPLARDLRKAF